MKMPSILAASTAALALFAAGPALADAAHGSFR